MISRVVEQVRETASSLMPGSEDRDRDRMLGGGTSSRPTTPRTPGGGTGGSGGGGTSGGGGYGGGGYGGGL